MASAGKLNKPSDFTSFGGQASGLVLLPPSSFESANSDPPNGVARIQPAQVRGPSESSGEPWMNVAKNVNDIVDLLDSYNRLRSHISHAEDSSKHQQTVDASAAFNMAGVLQQLTGAVHLLHSRMEQIDRFNMAGADNNKQLYGLQAQLELLNQQHSQQVQQLTADKELVEKLNKKLTEEVEQLKREHLQVVELHQSKLVELRQLHDQHVSNTVIQLENQLANVQKSAEENLLRVQIVAASEKEQLSGQLRECMQLIEQQQQEIHRMKIYLTESESLAQSSNILRQEIADLKHKLQIAGSENASIKDENKLLTTRLATMSDILTTQEKYLCQDTSSIVVTKKLLLTRWREKVYELLVQLKSAAIIRDQENHAAACKLAEANKKLIETETKCSTLVHMVKEKQAACDLNLTGIERLKLELQESKRDVSIAQDKNEHLMLSLSSLTSTVDSMCQAYSTNTEATFTQLFNRLRSFSNRVGFASGRLQLVQAELARYKAQAGTVDAEVETRSSSRIQFDVNGELEELKTELSRVVSERDKLAALIKHDADLLAERLTAATSQATAEAAELRQRLNELHFELDQKSSHHDEAVHQLDLMKSELEKSRLEIEQLNIQLTGSQQQVQEVIDDVKATVGQQYIDQITILEKDLNEAKRQYTKSVIHLRQLERQSDRDKERLASEKATIQAELELEIDRLQRQLQGLQTENNLLLSTMKQEGLLGRHSTKSLTSSARPAPVGYPVDFQDPAMDEVINDLKQLTSELIRPEDND